MGTKHPILNVEQCLLYNLEDEGINVIYNNSIC